MAQQLGNNYYNSPYKFNGKELDDETGFYYYGARYYDPRVSIWMSVDPMAEKTLEPYSYVRNNPINYIDPKGLFKTRIGAWLHRTFNGGGSDIHKNKRWQYYYITGKSDGKGGLEITSQYGSNGFTGKGRLFFGCPVTIIPEFFGGGSYFLGSIKVSQKMWDKYKEMGIDSYYGRFLMHEYGHYLQEKEGGVLWYSLYQALSSLGDAFINSQAEHDKHWAEIQASTFAYYYFGFPKNFKNENTINSTYISSEQQNRLFNESKKK